MGHFKRVIYMSINVIQFRDYIIKPALSAIGLQSDSAVNLLLGTAAQESHMGSYIVQMGLGYSGGIGIYQMEAGAYHNVWDNHIAPNVALIAKIRLFLGYNGKPNPQRMASDLSLASIMCRFYYYAIKKPLPESDNLKDLAEYWKKYYNTALGKGTIEQFMGNYEKYIGKNI